MTNDKVEDAAAAGREWAVTATLGELKEALTLLIRRKWDDGEAAREFVYRVGGGNTSYTWAFLEGAADIWVSDVAREVEAQQRGKQ